MHTKTSFVDKLKNIKPVYILVGSGFLSLVALSIVLLGSINDSARAIPENRERAKVLQADVVWTAESMLVKNLEPLDWHRCKFELNATEFGDGYGHLEETVNRGQRLKIDHREFRNSDGVVFDYSTERPKRFTIRCQNVDGRPGVYIGSQASQ